MKILLIESNLILASRVKNSLSGYEVRVGKDWQGEDVDLVVSNSKVVDAKSLLWENTEKER
ncbi:hypothetical protein [Thermocrinis sp.]|jgi:hypothetical protein|uniref:hypothetical protein n=1 Tax=Thermocrinis sp. TaxID=2024383 RepID=UPI003BFEE66E